MEKKPKIAYIGKFRNLWDEEYIAQAFEALGCEVLRMPERMVYTKIVEEVLAFEPDFVLFAKFDVANPDWVLAKFKKHGIKTVCWIFDLYWGYAREYQVKTSPMFRADIVITTDGGHDEKWKEMGIEHHTVRQGVHNPENYMCESDKEYDIVFVGSNNPNNPRQSMLKLIKKDFADGFTWFGMLDTDEVRSTKLNELYGKTKVVIGDSVYSPNYWSNRVVETLGRGGFLIHQETKGLTEAYPYLVTYKRGDYSDLKKKIEYYLENEEERSEIVRKNFEWVKENYTCQHQCSRVLDICKK